MEHGSDLYSRQNTVTPSALDAIDCLPSMDDLDDEPTIYEMIKSCKTALLLSLHDVLCQCWKKGAVPQDMRDAKIIPLYKNNPRLKARAEVH